MGNLFLQSVFVLFLAMIGTAYLVPKIISLVRYKKLMDNPNERSSHEIATPSLGGMAFYIMLMLSLYFNYRYDTYNISVSLFPSLTILFFLGLKDDLMVLAPTTKLAGQIVASSFLISNVWFSIGSFNGFLGIYQIPVWVSVILGFFILLSVINAFNLIDGIDGLAACVGIVAFTGFAVIFILAERYFLSLLSISMIGILIGFLFFNLSSKNKIFMGDTGSMIIGFMLGALSLRLLALDASSIQRLPFDGSYIPIVLFSFLLVPIYDTARVFIIRLMARKSPFAPDRNHLHHVVVDAYGISHRRASFSIAIVHLLCVVLIVFAVKQLNFLLMTLLLLFMITATTYYLHRLKVSIPRKAIKERWNRIYGLSKHTI